MVHEMQHCLQRMALAFSLHLAACKYQTGTTWQVTVGSQIVSPSA